MCICISIQVHLHRYLSLGSLCMSELKQLQSAIAANPLPKKQFCPSMSFHPFLGQGSPNITICGGSLWVLILCNPALMHQRRRWGTQKIRARRKAARFRILCGLEVAGELMTSVTLRTPVWPRFGSGRKRFTWFWVLVPTVPLAKLFLCVSL